MEHLPLTLQAMKDIIDGKLEVGKEQYEQSIKELIAKMASIDPSYWKIENETLRSTGKGTLYGSDYTPKWTDWELRGLDPEVDVKSISNISLTHEKVHYVHRELPLKIVESRIEKTFWFTQKGKPKMIFYTTPIEENGFVFETTNFPYMSNDFVYSDGYGPELEHLLVRIQLYWKGKDFRKLSQNMDHWKEQL